MHTYMQNCDSVYYIPILQAIMIIYALMNGRHELLDAAET